MRSKKYSCKKLALLALAAGALALPAASADAQVAIQTSSPGVINIGGPSIGIGSAPMLIPSGYTNTLTIGSPGGSTVPGLVRTSFDLQVLGTSDFYDTLTVSNIAGSSINTAPGTTGGAGINSTPVVTTIGGEAVTTFWTVTNQDASTTTTLTLGGGGATITTDGDVTLAPNNGATTTQTLTDAAVKTIVCNQASGCPGLGLGPGGTTTASFTGMWDSTNLTFDTGNVETTSTTAPGSGGNLTVNGMSTLNDDVMIDSNVNGASLTGGSTLDVTDLGVTMDGPRVDISGDTVTITGGTASTSITIDNAGIAVADSGNGSTFTLDNTGNAVISDSLTTPIVNASTVNAYQVNASTVSAYQVNASTVSAYQVNASTVSAAQVNASTVSAYQVNASTVSANNVYADYVSASTVSASTVNATNVNANNVLANNVTASNVLAYNVTASNVLAYNVTASNVLAYNVTASNVLASTVSANNVNANVVDANTVTANNVNANNVLANNVTASNVLAYNVTASNVLAYNVTASNVLAYNVTASNVLASTVSANNVNANVVDANTVTANNVYANVVDANTVTANNVYANVVDANTVTANYVNASTVNADNVDAGNVDADTLQVNTNANIDGNLDVGGNLEVDGTGDFHDTLTVSPDGTIITSSAGIATQGEQYVDDTTDPNLIKYVYSITTKDITETESTTIGEGVVIETNGDVTLNEATTSTTTTKYDTAKEVLINNNPLDCDASLPWCTTANGFTPNSDGNYFGDFISETASVPGLWRNGVFTPGQEEVIITSDVPNGGNLEMDGDLWVKGDAQIDGTLSVDRVASDGDMTLDAEGQFTVNAGDIDFYSEGDIDFYNDIDMEGHRVTDVGDPVHEHDATNKYYVDRADKKLKDDIDDNSDRLDEVGAMAAAFSAVQPNWKSPGNTQIAVGLGYYESEGALAAGIFHHINDNVMINAGVSTSFSDQETAGRVGITWGF